MNSVICTLFEKHYHYGVASLINSLYQNGFKGSIYVGYRGSLPPWTAGAKKNEFTEWKDASSYKVAEDLYVHFMPLNTDYHLTNYKPSFMLQLLEGPAKDAKGIVYFDPDIVVKCNWLFFENWISHGVALVHEDVHNDKPATHPIRMEWTKIIKRYNREIKHTLQSYISGGFCGVAKQDFEFLNTWKEFIQIGIEEYHADPKRIWSFDKTQPFCFLDQDALNISVMCTESAISEMGPEAMDFAQGGWTMSHATGSPKPWKKNFIWYALKGQPPSLAEKLFWSYATYPIANYNVVQLKLKSLGLLTSAFIGRFYRRR
ncbi:MAG: hypothetical protein ACTHJ5_03915 [Ilyomonas sp.]